MPKPQSFGATLELIQSPPATQPNVEPGLRDRPAALAFAPTFEEAVPSTHAGTGSLWDRASSWVPELEPEADVAPAPLPPPSPPEPIRRPAPSVDPRAIAAELKLEALATADAFNRLRRRFCWENHPDRYPDVPAAIANRRVAVANMLIDRALENLGKANRAR